MEKDGGISGRQMMNHLRDADRPCVILNHLGQVVFANAAASNQVGVPLENLNAWKRAQHDESKPAPSPGKGASYIPELQAWVDGAAVLGESQCQLIAAASDDSQYSHWLSVDLADQRSRGLLLFVGVRRSEHVTVGVATNTDSKARQELLEYHRTLNAQQHTLSRLLPLLGPYSATKLAMRQTQLAIESHAPALITGPKGCGKKTLAQAILFHRNRGNDDIVPPIVIGCQLLDKTLLREISELVAERLRLVKQSKGPVLSILLDRIDLLSVPCWVGMLELIKQASSASIVATSQHGADTSDLKPEQQELVHALGTITISLCPLVQRTVDIPIMIQHLLLRPDSKDSKPRSLSVSDEARHMLVDYSWPGNLAEFVAALSHAAAECKGKEIFPEHLPISIRTYPASLNDSALEPIDLEKVLSDAERSIIERALAHFPRNRAAAARHLGISRTKLFRKVQQFGISVGDEPDEQTPEKPETSASPGRKSKDLSTDEIVELAIEEGDELPVFREISDED